MALVVLLLVFRALVSAAIPIALAIVAVATAFILLFIVAGFTDVNTITPLLVSMIGLGVGIDYSLFIVTRFRQLLHEGLLARGRSRRGRRLRRSRRRSSPGSTVAISVTGLAFFGLDFVTKLGIGSALGVLTTVLMANSLLIAVLAKLGHRVDRMSAGSTSCSSCSRSASTAGTGRTGRYREARRRTGEGLGGVARAAALDRAFPGQRVRHSVGVGRMYDKAGREAPVRGLTGLWLFPFGVLIVPAIVWFLKIHRALERMEVPAARPADRRLRGRARADAHRALGPVRDAAPQAGVRRPPRRRTRCSRRARRSSGSAPRIRARSPPSRRPGGRTTCSPRASGPASTGRSRSWST